MSLVVRMVETMVNRWDEFNSMWEFTHSSPFVEGFVWMLLAIAQVVGFFLLMGVIVGIGVTLLAVQELTRYDLPHGSGPALFLLYVLFLMFSYLYVFGLWAFGVVQGAFGALAAIYLLGVGVAALANWSGVYLFSDYRYHLQSDFQRRKF